MNAGLESGGTRLFPTSLDFVLQGRLAMRQKSDPRKHANHGVTALAVTQITVLGDGVGKAKGRSTNENRPA